MIGVDCFCFVDDDAETGCSTASEVLGFLGRTTLGAGFSSSVSLIVGGINGRIPGCEGDFRYLIC